MTGESKVGHAVLAGQIAGHTVLILAIECGCQCGTGRRRGTEGLAKSGNRGIRCIELDKLRIVLAISLPDQRVVLTLVGGPQALVRCGHLLTGPPTPGAFTYPPHTCSEHLPTLAKASICAALGGFSADAICAAHVSTRLGGGTSMSCGLKVSSWLSDFLSSKSQCSVHEHPLLKYPSMQCVKRSRKDVYWQLAINVKPILLLAKSCLVIVLL